MSQAVLTQYPGNNWYSNTRCDYEYPMSAFNIAPSVENEAAIRESFNQRCGKKHIIIGQNLNQQFAPGEGAAEKVYDVFHHSGVYVSMDGIDQGRARARVLFIHDTDPENRTFQFNCTFNAAKIKESATRIRTDVAGQHYNISNISDDRLEATLLVGIIEKVAEISSRILHPQSNNNMPLDLTIDARPVVFPQLGGELLLSVENRPDTLPLRDAYAQIIARKDLVVGFDINPTSQAIEKERDALVLPLPDNVPANPLDEKKHIVDVVDNKDGAPPAGEQNISCLQYIGNLLASLFEALAGCFSSCWAKVCG